MLDQVRQETLGRRRGASTFEYVLLLVAIVVVVALVAFAFGSYLHSALHSCDPAAPAGASNSCMSAATT